jgi:photosystem II stability/assembly factor-like uncharacterized protein
MKRVFASAICTVAFTSGCLNGNGPDADVSARLDGLQCTGPAATGWCWQRPQPDGLATRDVSFVDADNGWLVGDGGLVMRSTDGGATWSRQSVATPSDLTQVRFVNAQDGWLAAALGGEVWRTTDGGQSWERSSGPPVRVLQRIWALSDQILVVTGNDGDRTADVSAVTEDGGQTWRSAVLVVDFVQADGTLWSYGRRSRSTDLGLTETSEPLGDWPADAFLRELGFGPAGSAWARLDLYDATSQSFEGLLSRRTSATGAWTTQPLLAPAADPAHQMVSLSLDPTGPGLGMVWPNPLPDGDSGVYTRFARTTDGGLNWSWIELPATGRVSAYGLIDARSMHVTMDNGSVLKQYLSTDGGNNWLDTLPLAPPPNDGSFRIERDGGGHLLRYTSRTPAEWVRSTNEGAIWQKLPSRHFDLTGIAALWIGADGRGAAIDETGAVLDTQDFGRAWAQRATPLARPDDVLLRRDGSGWMLAQGQLTATADGGTTWAAVPTATGVSSVPKRLLFADGAVLRLEAVKACDGPSGFQSCPTVLHASDDGGQTWTEGIQKLRDIGPFGPARPTLSFATPEVAVRVGFSPTNEQIVERSTDGGRTWVGITLPTLPGSVRRVQFDDAHRGWLLGDNGVALNTLDGGATWRVMTLPAPTPRNGAIARPRLNAALLADANTAWIVGDDGTVLSTGDGGANWTVQLSGTPYSLKTLFALDARTVWIGGEHGAIHASTSAGVAGP